MSFSCTAGEDPQVELLPPDFPELPSSELRCQAANSSYSALFKLRNNNRQLRLTLHTAYCDGRWLRRPPSELPPNRESLFCGTSDTFCWGVEGEIVFLVQKNSANGVLCELKISFDVPAVGPNRILLEVSFR